MQKRTLKVALLAALATILVLSFSSIALADQTWSDLPDTVTAKYGITDNQVAGISDGFPDGTWKPYQAVTRAQFTKMAVLAFDIPLADPATPSFTDVPKGSLYYQYIEGAKAAAITNGTTPTTFGPNQMVTRAQAVAIVARYVAMANGYDLATMYTSQQVSDLLSHFGDAASISSALQVEVAFAYDMGITTGDAFGNFNPQGNMLRIQGAAFLIRAQGLVPPENWTAADLELVSADKSENLIGKTHSVTFEVTTADGHPAKDVLVDFDTAFADPYYVGNISPQAAMTDSFGRVTVNMLSSEPGTQRLYATIVTPDGLVTEMTTKYWVALDEVYLTDPDGEMDPADLNDRENNAGEEDTFCYRVVVFGPGPLSTSQYDWYNVENPDADPADLDEWDGYDWFSVDGDYNYAAELHILSEGDVPRTMAGVDLEWLLDSDDFADPEDLIVSADSVTDADGLGCITLSSDMIGTVEVSVVATYPENPYPKQLFLHDTFQPGTGHDYDWGDQPSEDNDYATKTWIPHIIGGDEDGPITPAYAVNNTGEVEEFTLTLEDVFGNPIEGYTVEWWIQGVGEFKTDDSSWSGVGEQNRDWDLTDADGQAVVWVKSLIPGQTIVHVKVMDKTGLPYKEWNVVKQWYSIDDVRFIDKLVLDDDDLPVIPVNLVDTGHTFNVQVSGAKYMHVLYDVNGNGLMDDQALIGNRADLKAAKGTVATLVHNVLTWVDKPAGTEVAPGQVFKSSVGALYSRPVEVVLGDAEFWADRVMGPDDIDEVWSGLEGKCVYFFNNIGPQFQVDDGLTAKLSVPMLLGPASNTPLPTLLGRGIPWYVGQITSTQAPDCVETDADGMASVDINSQQKGLQFVWAVADYEENPQDGDPLLPLEWAELRYDFAVKLWTPDVDDSVSIFAQAAMIEGDRWTNPILEFGGYTSTVPLTIDPPLAGTVATGVEATIDGAGAVTGFTGLPSGANYTEADVGQEVTAALPSGAGATADATVGGTPSDNQVIQISVTAGGTGYTVAPTVVIDAPAIPGGTQATATATVSGGSVVSVTITDPGSGYLVATPPNVTFTANAAPGGAVVGTIATVASGQVTAITPVAGTPFTAVAAGSYPVTFPPLVKTTATGTAFVTDGVVTGVSLTDPGAGYVDGQIVNVVVGGGGTGAFVQATVNADSTISLALLAGGSGYGGNTSPSANPNRDTIAVQVFDQFGNALEGYKVTWEIIGQGTTTAGTINTYHPYAHFELPAHDFDDMLAGTGDRNPLVDANPVWSSATGDDDYAWGWTLDHQINFTKDLASAAHVDLVLDEWDLAPGGHYTDIVNIKVYRPDGSLMMQKEVTKVWSTDPPVLTYLDLSVSTSLAGPWVTDMSTNVALQYFRVRLLDQYGDPWLSTANVALRVSGPLPDTFQYIPVPGPVDPDGYAVGGLPLWSATGLHTLTAYYDVNPSNGLLDAGELTSNSATITAQ